MSFGCVFREMPVLPSEDHREGTKWFERYGIFFEIWLSNLTHSTHANLLSRLQLHPDAIQPASLEIRFDDFPSSQQSSPL